MASSRARIGGQPAQQLVDHRLGACLLRAGQPPRGELDRVEPPRHVVEQLLAVDARVLGQHRGGVHQVADALGGGGRRAAAVAFEQPAQAAPQRALHRGRCDPHRLALVDQRPVVGERPQPPPVVGMGARHARGGEAGQLGRRRAPAGGRGRGVGHDGTEFRDQRRQGQRSRRPRDRQVTRLLRLKVLVARAASERPAVTGHLRRRTVVTRRPRPRRTRTITRHRAGTHRHRRAVTRRPRTGLAGAPPPAAAIASRQPAPSSRRRHHAGTHLDRRTVVTRRSRASHTGASAGTARQPPRPANRRHPPLADRPPDVSRHRRHHRRHRRHPPAADRRRTVAGVRHARRRAPHRRRHRRPSARRPRPPGPPPPAAGCAPARRDRHPARHRRPDAAPPPAQRHRTAPAGPPAVGPGRDRWARGPSGSASGSGRGGPSSSSRNRLGCSS